MHPRHGVWLVESLCSAVAVGAHAVWLLGRRMVVGSVILLSPRVCVCVESLECV